VYAAGGGVLRFLTGFCHIENGGNGPQSVGFRFGEDDNFVVYIL